MLRVFNLRFMSPMEILNRSTIFIRVKAQIQLSLHLFEWSNYLVWSRSMQRALWAKNKLSFMDGSIEVPDSLDMNRETWEQCNYLVPSQTLSFGNAFLIGRTVLVSTKANLYSKSTMKMRSYALCKVFSQRRPNHLVSHKFEWQPFCYQDSSSSYGTTTLHQQNLFDGNSRRK